MALDRNQGNNRKPNLGFPLYSNTFDTVKLYSSRTQHLMAKKTSGVSCFTIKYVYYFRVTIKTPGSGWITDYSRKILFFEKHLI